VNKIAVFTNNDSKLCEFFDATRVLIFERGADGWKSAGQKDFEKIPRANLALTRQKTEALLPLIDGCDVVAGGTLVGIPFTVFDRAGRHIFEIGELNDGVLDGIVEEICSANAEAAAKEAIIRDAKPVETSTPGVYFLDLIALQKECPEISSKQAMMDFLKDTPLLELRLVCKHVPPWIENSGAYNVQVVKNENGAVEAVITRRC
jgi:hypothetical protein